MAAVRASVTVTGQTAHATPGTAVAVSIPIRDFAGNFLTPDVIIPVSRKAGTPGALSVGTITAASGSTAASVNIHASAASEPFDLIAYVISDFEDFPG